MSIEGYADYQRREFCKDIPCPVQERLNTLKEGSEEYEEVREVCKTACRFSAHVFHKWLIDRGYLIIRPQREVG